MYNSWHDKLEQLQQSAQACVLITIFATKGSTPRAVGSKMLVTAEASMLSIGGGHLEYQAIKRAQNMLKDQNSQPFIESFSLGARLGQCCGGHVELLFEAFYPVDRQVAIFGAGHIANALVPILEQLPCSIIWADSRRALFPTTSSKSTKIIITDELCDVIEQLENHCHVLIMTHNHQLDMQLCEALLNRAHNGFIGVIGSTTKWKKFKLRLTNKGYAAAIDKINCPIGIAEISGKLPMEVAISVSGQFIQMYQSEQHVDTQHNGASIDQELKIIS